MPALLDLIGSGQARSLGYLLRESSPMKLREIWTLVLWLICLAPAVAGAQVRTTGQVVGVVKDATGSVIVKADLVLIDTTTGLTYEAKSRDDGGFVFPNLQPGTYTLTATASGFRPLTLQQIVVQTSRTAEITVQFQVAGVTEQINVEGRTSVVETTSSTISSTVRNAEIAKLPLLGRNVLDFALLVPGAAQSADRPLQPVQRPAERRDQHHARRRQQQLAALPQRRHELLHVRARAARRDRRGDGLHRRPERRRRRGRRGADPVRHAARHQRVPRPGVRAAPQRHPEREQRVQRARNIPKIEAAAERVRRQSRRPDHQEQAVLLRQLRKDPCSRTRTRAPRPC